MKHIYFIASLLRSKFVMNGMRVGYDTPDNQPTVKANVTTTSCLCNQRESSARVAEICCYGSHALYHWCRECVGGGP